ncbi:TonB-dependent receptor [Vitiosangium sp. GDMCC 1.1324]|uniref:TonB-dependent receptor n=1 Tax=Vitiosangium sp. (strain GDMCC 1.1324) TaxID=2138576 RepID=UPI000D3BAFF5|nr:TonB-dependent receptor [Vitiosangium sp. GDMCC 1.1324]PTL78986.1 TonB-dependent receptor [Vitiosangium sp. GDMCC 1.1324]
MTNRSILRHSGPLVLAVCLAGHVALAQGASVILGTVTDAATHQPVADVVVTATSPNLQGEQTVVTDASGQYRIPQLPPGLYTLRFDRESYKPLSRANINLRLDYSVRVNVELLPETLVEEMNVVAQTPTVDIGSASTGVNVSTEFMRNIAVVSPSGKGAASRSFEALAELAPGASADTYGVSVNGATSPENQYIVDGVSVNDPGFGINGTPLSVEFIGEVNVISGGYLPEYGRSTGGVVNAVTKSGSNEFHGSVFGNITPGAFAAPGSEIIQQAGTVSGRAALWNLGDIGFELGGPILRDRLWFYAGVAPSFTRYQLERNLNAQVLDASGNPVEDERGFIKTQRIDGTQDHYFADQRSLQYIAKLTYLLNQDHNVSVSVTGTPSSSGGPGHFSLSERTGLPEVAVINGQPGALATQRISSGLDASLKWSSSFLDKRLLFNATLGWHHQDMAVRASDGTQAGTLQGLSGISNTTWQRTDSSQHSITEFESLPDPSVCFAPESAQGTRCPVLGYATGGPGRLDESKLDRYQGKFVGTLLLQGAGQHVIKAGLDLEQLRYDHIRAVTGKSVLIESDDGSYFYDYRQYGYLVGPDEVQIQAFQHPVSLSNSIGGFVQDSWSLFDMATLNVGVRYDTQQLIGGGKLAMSLANQWSPRLGLIVDPTRSGKAKFYANYARYYESVPLDLVDRSFPGEPGVRSNKSSELCDPRDPAQQQGICNSDVARLPSQSPLDANRLWETVGAGATIVDPSIKPQSTDEFVVGGEYELLTNTRAGLSYTHRAVNTVIEDMSRDDGATYFIGNPGQGFAKDFVKPERTYDAVTVFFQRNFADQWLAQVSYTASYLRGNYEGLFRSDTGQLDPNINSDFDLVSLLPNRYGPLPADRTHQIKAFGAREFMLRPDLSINLGLSYRASSGTPYSYLGAHEDYGAGQAFILPRGEAGRLPWTHRIDSRLALNYRMTQQLTASFSVDVFNLFNFQAPVAYDQNYTYSAVLPIKDGTAADLPGKLVSPDGQPIDASAINKNFGKPIAYQSPRSLRFGARLSF